MQEETQLCPGCAARDEVLTREVPRRIAELERASKISHEIGRLRGIVEERRRSLKEARLKALRKGPASWIDHILPWRRRDL